MNRRGISKGKLYSALTHTGETGAEWLRFHGFGRDMNNNNRIIIKSLFREGKPNEHMPIFLGALKTFKYTKYTIQSNKE